ncbi:PAS domain-containing protein [Emcibacter nanhaiensis]|uniref:PAS domain-containing protein n=1 Tax=Emcibacter nanhaiensis TaxID=1505037 RepID=A0A501PGM3_9PROT|nr:PAS domain-containing protein [Emcibacter nanhaiensis]TPD59172.1 PAS domain-containing protein [Emcibacter nanhaiensis]
MSGSKRLGYFAEKELAEEEIPQRHPVRLFADHWRDIGGDKSIPARKDFSPIRIPNLLPYVAVVELVDTEEGPDLRTRLEGEYIVSLSGRNNRGHSLRNLMSEERFQKRLAEARKVLKSGQVYFSVNDLLDYRNESHTVIRGIFPFRMNGSETGQVFIVLADKDSSIV